MNVYPATGVAHAEAITPPWLSAVPFAVDLSLDLSGPGLLSGVVRVAGVPAARVVEIYDQATLELAASTTSDGTSGAWTVSGLTVSRPLRAIVRGSTGERDVTIPDLYAEAP